VNKHTLLLVDDEENILRTLERVLRHDDYVILTARNAREGLAILEKDKTDLIISDQKMPGMDGLEFLEKTIESCPDVIRIILSGHAELQDALRAINNGCVYKFILKPFNNEDLKITVKRALEQRELLLRNRFLTLELKVRDRILEELERKHPGITESLHDNTV